jgi:hypothetical protein
MSDALTDIARDQWREEEYKEYLRFFIDYLEKPNKKKFKKLLEAAESTDSVPRGYWKGRTALADKLQSNIDLLNKRDAKAWATLMFKIKDLFWTGHPLYQKVKKMSPWQGKIVMLMNCGSGRQTEISGELVEYFDDIVSGRGMCVDDGDVYLITMEPMPVTVDWIGKPYSKETSPYKKDRKKSK